jgi:sulfate adenylyltransferase subunit 1 (EFTu-like GTPase family)
MNTEDQQIVNAIKTIAKAVGEEESWYIVINALEYGNVICPDTHTKWFNLCDSTKTQRLLALS